MKVLFAVRLRIPILCKTELGKSAPKADPKGKADGKLVKIPVLVYVVKQGRRRRLTAS